MSDERDPLSSDELRAIFDSLPRPAARPEFRDALRAQFRDGSLDPAAGEAASAAPGPSGAVPGSADPDTEGRTASPGKVLRPRWWQQRPILLLAAAAALLLLILPLSQATARSWDVVGIAGSGRVKIDDEWFTIHDQGDTAELSRRLRQGARLETDGSVEVTVRSESLLLCLKPGACIELPTEQGWWHLGQPAPLRSRLMEGSVHVLTGLPSSRPLHLETADTVVKLQDCTVGVQCTPEGTCVLVLKGCAQVEGEGGDCEVLAGTRRWPCPIEKHPRVDPLTDEQVADLDKTQGEFTRLLNN